MVPASTRSMLRGMEGKGEGGGQGGGRGQGCFLFYPLRGDRLRRRVDNDERTLGSHLHDALSGDLADP